MDEWTDVGAAKAAVVCVKMYEWTLARTVRVVEIGLYHVMTSYVSERFRSMPRTARP